MGCLATKQQIKEVPVFVSNKDGIKEFLDSPYAQSERYVIEALK